MQRSFARTVSSTTDRYAFVLKSLYVQPRRRKMINKIGIGIPRSQSKIYPAAPECLIPLINCPSGIDNELPGIRIVKHGSGESPNDEDDNRSGENPRATRTLDERRAKIRKASLTTQNNLSTLCVR
jgi:hypothetical protein